MEPVDPSIEAFRFIEPRQQRIYQRLLLLGPGPAAFYRDACRLLALYSPLSASTHLVAHCLREIESALRAVLQPFAEVIPGESTQRGQQNSHEKGVRAVLRGLGIPEEDEVAQHWLQITNSEVGLASRAHRNALAAPHPLDQEFREFWRGMETVLDAVLAKFEARYLESHRLVDELLSTPAPNDRNIRTLRQQVPNNLVALGYFFDHLTSVDWLQPLHAAGFFNDPPQPEYDNDRGTVRFPPWPASAYLTRMASESPAIVLEIALELAETANMRVHEDLTDAALAMPPALAARWASQEIEWIRSQEFLYLGLPDRLGRLVEHLASAGESEISLQLATAMLRLGEDPQIADPEIDEAHRRYFIRPRALCRPWEYGQLLHNYVPGLVRAVGLSALVLLCNLLEDAVRLSSAFLAADASTGHIADYSHVWAPTLSSTHPEREEIRELLVSTVYDAAIRVTEESPALMDDLVRTLEGRQLPIFQRIVLSLLHAFPDAAPGLIGPRLTKREHFEDTHYRHEYVALLHTRFGWLLLEEQEIILSWIEEGPSLERFAELPELEATEKSRAYTRVWQRDWLAVISEHLNEEWVEQYDALIAESGPAEPLWVFRQFETRQLPSTVAEAADEFSTLSVEAVVNYIESWQPRDDWDAPSRDDLARTLTQAVATNPTRFALEAQWFQRLDPTFVFALLEGWRQGVEQPRFLWEPVLDFCQWVLEHTSRLSETVATDKPGEEWAWLRTSIAGLLAAGFKQGEAEIPINLRGKVWELLEPLTNDSNPTVEEEARYEGAKIDYAIRTTRGEALHAVVGYAFWVRRNSVPATGNEVDHGLDSLPEVRQVLEAHLNPTIDPSLAVRAIYGRRFPDLLLLDYNWTSRHAATIFSFQAASRDWGAVAWGTYITSYHPFNNLLDLLHDQYLQAVDLIGYLAFERGFLDDPDERLAEHLIVFYARGRLGPYGEDNLLFHFFRQAPDNLRAHAIEHIGRSLWQAETVDTDVLMRLQELWDWRLAHMRQYGPAGSYNAELNAFSWWYASGKFPEAWAIEHLKEALSKVVAFIHNHIVLERLAAIARLVPLAAVESLSLIVEKDAEVWALFLIGDSTRTILTCALESNNEAAQQAARALINRLGARGHLEFQDLL